MFRFRKKKQSTLNLSHYLPLVKEYIRNHIAEEKQKEQIRLEEERRKAEEQRIRDEKQREKAESDRKSEESQKTRSPFVQYSRRQESLHHPVKIPDNLSQDSMHDFLKELREGMLASSGSKASATYHEWEKKNSVQGTFSFQVMKHLQRLDEKPAAFYKSAGIDKKIFSRLKNDYEYKPSKDTAIRCCFGLQLPIDEADSLLRLAGYSLSPADPRDLAIRFCISNHIYELCDVNTLLESLEERAFE